jgi:hypothetical protein
MMSVFHIFVRLLGLAGLLAGAVGMAIVFGEMSHVDVESLRAAFHGAEGALIQGALYAVAVGWGAALLIFLIDALAALLRAAGRRSLLGLNVVLQVALATVLLLSVNAFSFWHYRRWDLTRDQVFTLHPDIVDQLKQLRDETTIIVYQQRQPAARLSSQPPDRYDLAAERKVVEKVKDLVELFREFGPQFQVVVLDVEEEGYDRKLSELTRRYPQLEPAIRSAPESSILFCSGPHVQRMGFSEFYRLDKTESREANGGKGNLVLWDQGITTFTRHILSIEEKRPRVAVLVSHPWLSTEGQVEEYTLAGLRKSLQKYGFDVRDILTNKLVGRRGRGLRLEKAALSLEESRLDRVEAQLSALRLQRLQGQAELDRFRELLDLFRSSLSDEQVSEKLSVMFGRRLAVGPQERAKNIRNLEERLPELEQELAEKAKKERELETEWDVLQAQESVSEGQRETDLYKKMGLLLSDCDVLIVARMTLIDTSIGDVVPNSLHQLDEQHVRAIKEFVQAGKPLMFCGGPTNEPPDNEMFNRSSSGPDGLENLLTELGVVLAPQAVLYDAEAEAYAANQVLAFGRGGGIESIPPLEFTQNEVATVSLSDSDARTPNPLGKALLLVQRSAGSPIDLRVRYPRPIYYRPRIQLSNVSASFLQTIRACWNEDNPYPTDERPIPRFEPPKPDDAKRGTLHERRRGPFPVGIAVEAVLPAAWSHPEVGAAEAARFVGWSALAPGGVPSFFAAATTLPPDFGVLQEIESRITPRLVVIGHGGWFAGPDLSAAQESLLTHSLNWLLRRDDRLPHAQQAWQFPRVDLSDRELYYWHMGTFIGLPLLFSVLGFVVMMIRHTR